MAKLSESVLRRLIKTGETNTVELKVAAPRATEMAEWHGECTKKSLKPV